MKKLSEVLTHSYDDAEYLNHQRKIHAERVGRMVADVTKNSENAEFIERCKKDAVNAMNNMFILPGTRGKLFHVGTPPRWSECLTDDEEYLWSLNRMGYFKQLCRLYLLCGEEEYAAKVLSDLENWIDTCPLGPLPNENTTREQMNEIRRFFSGLTPWRSLEVGIRMFDSWNYVYKYLLNSDLMTPELHSKIAYSFYEHALVLREMSPRYWPEANHNHYIHEMLGLFEIACLFPDFTESCAWREFAIAEMVRCARAQFTEDGGQLEGSPGYHNGCLGMFFSFVEEARTFGIELPREILDTCKKATDYLLASIGPDGIITPFGDTAYSTVGPEAARKYYRCFGELGPTEKLFAIHPENDRDVIPEQAQAKAREAAASAKGECNLQRQINQYFARTGWGRDDSHFGFMCQSPVFNGHSHIDPMTFVLYLKGDSIVVDPSYYTYRECEERRLFKSPEYHSTLTIGGKPPYEYVSRWSFTPQKEGGIRRSYRSEGIFAVDASHHCYDPDYHKRLCALIGEDIFIVADDVANLTHGEVNIYFHLDDPTVKADVGVASSERVKVLLPEGVCAEVAPASKALHTDITEPTSRLILSDKKGESRQYLTVFTKRDDVSDAKIERTDGGVKISYRVASEEKSFLWAFSESFKRI